MTLHLDIKPRGFLYRQLLSMLNWFLNLFASLTYDPRTPPESPWPRSTNVTQWFHPISWFWPHHPFPFPGGPLLRHGLPTEGLAESQEGLPGTQEGLPAPAKRDPRPIRIWWITDIKPEDGDTLCRIPRLSGWELENRIISRIMKDGGRTKLETETP